MNCHNLTFSRHALTQMFVRAISTSEVAAAVKSGEVIEIYPDDKPFPCVLLMASNGSKVLHVVVAQETTNKNCVIVTAYEPDPNLWDTDFKRKQKK